MVKLFMVGFPLDIPEAELIELITVHGMLHDMTLVKDELTGKSKGYGFLQMLDRQGAERVITALNGRVLKGRKLTVKFADEQRKTSVTNTDVAA